MAHIALPLPSLLVLCHAVNKKNFNTLKSRTHLNHFFLPSVSGRHKEQQKLNEHQLTVTMGHKILLSHKVAAQQQKVQDKKIPEKSEYHFELVDVMASSAWAKFLMYIEKYDMMIRGERIQ